MTCVSVSRVQVVAPNQTPDPGGRERFPGSTSHRPPRQVNLVVTISPEPHPVTTHNRYSRTFAPLAAREANVVHDKKSCCRCQSVAQFSLWTNQKAGSA